MQLRNIYCNVRAQRSSRANVSDTSIYDRNSDHDRSVDMYWTSIVMVCVRRKKYRNLVTLALVLQ